MERKIWQLLANPLQKKFIFVLILVNILGSIYGYYWYKEQLLTTPSKFLLFVPDSPFSTTLFALMLILILFHRRYSLLELFACAGVIKYGIWAAVVNFDILFIGGNFTFMNFMLATSHLGMAVEGFVFIRHIKINKVLIGLTLLWMLLNDFMDYGLGVHPYLFDDAQWGVALSTVLILTAGITLYMIYLKDKTPKTPSQ